MYPSIFVIEENVRLGLEDGSLNLTTLAVVALMYIQYGLIVLTTASAYQNIGSAA